MGRKLSDAERAHRIVNSVHIRTLGATGTCQLCKEKIPKGEKSLRYKTINRFRSTLSEVGICMDCAARIWEHAEDMVGRVSMAVEAHKAGQSVADTPLPEKYASAAPKKKKKSAGKKQETIEPGDAPMETPDSLFFADPLAEAMRCRQEAAEMVAELSGNSETSR